MSGVQDLLTEGEELQESCSPSMKDSRYIKSYLASGLLTVAIITISFYPIDLGFNKMYFLALLVVPGFIFLKEEIYRHYVDYYITSEQVIMRRGILNQKTESTTYSNITDVTLSKALNERIFDVGDLRVNTAGHDGTTLVLNGLNDPERYKRMIENNINDLNTQGGQNGGFDNSGFGDSSGGFDDSGFGDDSAFDNHDSAFDNNDDDFGF